jgi:glycosyltransferase involved in cell wall biosynthesis
MTTSPQRAPRVSVVMAVYNGEAFLSQAVESILAQTFADFEFVVIDDGSTDSTESLLGEYSRRDSRIQVTRQPNAGYVAALNAGCAVARGELIARMDADDLSEPGRLARQVAFLDERPEVAVVGSSLLLITAEGRPFYIAAYPQEPDDARGALARGNPLGHSTVLIRRSALEAVGGYRAAFVDAEDYDLWVRIARSYEIANLPDLLGCYRIHPDNTSHRNLARQAVSIAAARASVLLNQGAGSTFSPDEPLSEGALKELGVDKADVAEIVVELGLWWGAIGIRAGVDYRELARQAWKQAHAAARQTRDPMLNRKRIFQRQAEVEFEVGHYVRARILSAKGRLARRNAAPRDVAARVL